MSVFSGFVTICLFGIALAEPSPDACPYYKTMSDFNIFKFLGRWYTVKRQESSEYADCGTADYTVLNNGTVKFLHSHVDPSTDLTTSWTGIFVSTDFTKPAQLKMKYVWTPVERNYWILDTDYVTYAIIYECKKVESSIIKYAWILTRKQHDVKTVLKYGNEVDAVYSNVLLNFNTDNMACMP